MNPIERALRRVDRYQQRHGWLGFVFAVVKKFGDDKGGNLTTLLAWNGFFALFPLLLILVTGLGFLLSRRPALEQRVLHSTRGRQAGSRPLRRRGRHRERRRPLGRRGRARPRRLSLPAGIRPAQHSRLAYSTCPGVWATRSWWTVKGQSPCPSGGS
jgi:hypothetical protein